MSEDALLRGKTYRKSHTNLDVSGALALGFSERAFNFLNLDADNALKRPWHKLERGLRIGRIRDFSSRETERLKLSPEDNDALFKLLIRGLDKKIINSKAAVTYNSELEQITEIKGLVAHTTSSGSTKFQLIEKKQINTQKRRAPVALKECNPLKDPVTSSNSDGV